MDENKVIEEAEKAAEEVKEAVENAEVKAGEIVEAVKDNAETSINRQIYKAN